MHKKLIGTVKAITVTSPAPNAAFTTIVDQDGRFIGGVQKLVLTLDLEKSPNWSAEMDGMVLSPSTIAVNGVENLTMLHRALCPECKQIKHVAEADV